MSTVRETDLGSYIQFFESLRPESVDELRRVVSPDVRFRDPFNDLTGAESMMQALREMFDFFDEPRFRILESARFKRFAVLKWKMTGRPKRSQSEQPWEIEGFSELRFDEQGRVREHIDYWDAASQFYEKLPVIGWVLRLIRGRMKVDCKGCLEPCENSQ